MQHSLFTDEGLPVMVWWTAFAITFEQQVFLQTKLTTCFVINPHVSRPTRFSDDRLKVTIHLDVLGLISI